ncbi:MAG: nucleoside monophosphate kinase [Candidatus Staskawiczbacteria bacterium]|nr:nucleoside monophosphate kinase [Candidatus Staskawiczbacteria bacterium]
MSKQVIILFGQPGAGKGTQAEILSGKTGYYHFESSKVIEACFQKESPEKVFEIDGEKFKVADEKIRWETGLLNSPPFVVNLMVEKIRELADEGKSIIFSGSPRTIYEAEKEIPLLKELFCLENIKFVMLEISPEITIARNSHRRICELIRHSILFSPETETLTKCPLDGSDLVKRKGLDDVETIKKRLEVFKEQTFPVVEVIEKQGLKLNKINGEQTVSDVHKDIVETIK